MKYFLDDFGNALIRFALKFIKTLYADNIYTMIDKTNDIEIFIDIYKKN